MKNNKVNRTYLIILTVSFMVFLLSCFGTFDWLSSLVARALYNSLGYTNKWSHTYGPSWFLGIQNDISSFGSREIILLISIFLYFYIKLNRSEKDANSFLFLASLGIIPILIMKIATSSHDELTFHSVLTESISSFPSGHAYIATIVYYSAVQSLSLRNTNPQAKKYLFISASILIALIGISRILGHYHTVTEVIAGWSLGLSWFAFAQLFLNKKYHSLINK